MLPRRENTELILGVDARRPVHGTVPPLFGPFSFDGDSFGVDGGVGGVEALASVVLITSRCLVIFELESDNCCKEPRRINPNTNFSGDLDLPRLSLSSDFFFFVKEK
jgi:hypothetical protein